MEVHQILAVAADSDPITREALLLQAALNKLGRSEVFAYRQEGPVFGVRPLSQFKAIPKGEAPMLVVHDPSAEPALDRFLGGQPGRLLLRCHGNAPTDAVRRQQLKELMSRFVGALASSKVAAARLRSLGCESSVVPLLVEPDRLVRLKPRPPVTQLPPTDEGPMILCVGPLAPSQGQHLVLKAFHILKTYLRRDAHLVLVGKEADPVYALSLRTFVRELALPDVALAEQLSDPELAFAHRRADVHLSMVPSGGLDVSLIDSIGLGVPIVARGPGVVEEMVGGAGIVIDDLHPVLAAEAVARILGDTDLKQERIAGCMDRARDLDPGPAGARLVEEILRAT